jgi:hypothetical protein
MTGRLTPLSLSASATPTVAGIAQPMPPLAVAKNDPVLVVGSHLDLLGHGGGRFVDNDGIGRPDPAQHGVDL